MSRRSPLSTTSPPGVPRSTDGPSHHPVAGGSSSAPIPIHSWTDRPDRAGGGAGVGSSVSRICRASTIRDSGGLSLDLLDDLRELGRFDRIHRSASWRDQHVGFPATGVPMGIDVHCIRGTGCHRAPRSGIAGSGNRPPANPRSTRGRIGCRSIFSPPRPGDPPAIGPVGSVRPGPRSRPARRIGRPAGPDPSAGRGTTEQAAGIAVVRHPRRRWVMGEGWGWGSAGRIKQYVRAGVLGDCRYSSDRRAGGAAGIGMLGVRRQDALRGA